MKYFLSLSFLIFYSVIVIKVSTDKVVGSYKPVDSHPNPNILELLCLEDNGKFRWQQCAIPCLYPITIEGFYSVNENQIYFSAKIDSTISNSELSEPLKKVLYQIDSTLKEKQEKTQRDQNVERGVNRHVKDGKYREVFLDAFQKGQLKLKSSYTLRKTKEAIYLEHKGEKIFVKNNN